MNYYKILELKENASVKEIKEAYRKLTFEYSPDRNPDNIEIEQKFKLISIAYEKLINNNLKFEIKHTITKVQKNFIVDAEPPKFDLWGNVLSEKAKNQWVDNLKTPIDKIHKKQQNSSFKDVYRYENDEDVPDLR